MFGWLRKKVPVQSTESLEESVEQELDLGDMQAGPTSVETPRMVDLPPMPPSAEIPVAPPSSGDDEWASMMEAPEEPARPPVSVPSPRDSGRIPTPPASPATHLGDGTPDLLVPGATMRAIPEKQPATPRGWNVKVVKTDAEGIWVARVAGELEPLPVAAKEVLALVIFDERKQVSYDCPIIRIKAGNPELILVGRPLNSKQEKSKLDSLGGRQHFRIETQLPVEVKLPGLAGKGIPPLSGHTRDISKGGMALMLARRFDLGRELDVRVLSWNFPLQIRAKVVRCEEEANGRFSVAVAFPDDMSSITRDLVGHFIMENQRGR